MKIIGLIGEPAAGKSTVIKNYIATLGEGEIVKDGLVVYTEYKDAKVIVAGKYEPGVTFCGTDTLSKGCGPKYREWLEKVNDDLQMTTGRLYSRVSGSQTTPLWNCLRNSVQPSTTWRQTTPPWMKGTLTVATRTQRGGRE